MSFDSSICLTSRHNNMVLGNLSCLQLKKKEEKHKTHRNILFLIERDKKINLKLLITKY